MESIVRSCLPATGTAMNIHLRPASERLQVHSCNVPSAPMTKNTVATAKTDVAKSTTRQSPQKAAIAAELHLLNGRERQTRGYSPPLESANKIMSF